MDSNICVYLLRDKKGIRNHIRKIRWENCCISEITVIELLYGAECSNAVEANMQEVRQLCADLNVIPISVAIEEFARQKARLRREGKLIDDFDLLIGMYSQSFPMRASDGKPQAFRTGGRTGD